MAVAAIKWNDESFIYILKSRVLPYKSESGNTIEAYHLLIADPIEVNTYLEKATPIPAVVGQNAYASLEHRLNWMQTCYGTRFGIASLKRAT
jgi:hypothetical protein